MKKLSISVVKTFVNNKCESAFSKFDNSDYKEYLKSLNDKYLRYQKINVGGLHDEGSIAFLSNLQAFERAFFDFKQAEEQFFTLAQTELNARTNVIEVFNEALEAIQKDIPSTTFERLEAINGNVINALCVDKTKAKEYFTKLVFLCQNEEVSVVDTNKISCVIRLIERFGNLDEDKEKAINEIYERIEGIFTLDKNELTYILKKLGYIKSKTCSINSFSLPSIEPTKPNLEDILDKVNNSAKLDKEQHIQRLTKQLEEKEAELSSKKTELTQATNKDEILLKTKVKKLTKEVERKRKEIEEYK